jgi:hypothetical protein
MVVGFDGEWSLLVPSTSSSRASHCAASAVATSFFKPFHDKHLPPIHCEEHSEQDRLDLVRRRAKGEDAQGRGDGAENEGPATAELKKLLKGSAKKLAALAKKHKCPPKIVEEITKATPWKIEKIKRRIPDAVKPKPKAKLGLQQRPNGPALCGRHELINEGPFPLEKRLGELAAHSYYLWGDAKYLVHKAEGTSVEVLAHTIERFCREADRAARNLATNQDIPMSMVPPRLPLSVVGSEMPSPLLALPPPAFPLVRIVCPIRVVGGATV